jgi:hypothetical protein
MVPENSMNEANAFPHKPLLEELIRAVQRDIAYYGRWSGFNYGLWHWLSAITILLAGASSLIAALVPADELKQALWRGLLISLPIVGAVISAFLKTFNFHDKEKNLEIGLIEAERLLRNLKSQQASATSEAEYRDAYVKGTEALAKLSLSQHRLDVAARKGIDH